MTLIDLIMVIAILATLAAAAYRQYQIFVAKSQIVYSYLVFQSLKRDISQYVKTKGRVPFAAELPSVIPKALISSNDGAQAIFRIESDTPYYFIYWSFGQYPEYTNGDPHYGGFSLNVVFENDHGNSPYIAGRRYQAISLDYAARVACTVTASGMSWYDTQNPIPEKLMPASCRDHGPSFIW